MSSKTSCPANRMVMFNNQIGELRQPVPNCLHVPGPRPGTATRKKGSVYPHPLPQSLPWAHPPGPIAEMSKLKGRVPTWHLGEPYWLHGHQICWILAFLLFGCVHLHMFPCVLVTYIGVTVTIPTALEGLKTHCEAVIKSSERDIQ